MNSAVAATVFTVVFTAELPDKTSVAGVLLGSRFRPLYVFAGVACAFAVHAVLAVAAGSLLAALPRRPLEIMVGTVFLVGAAALLLRRTGRADRASAREPGGAQEVGSAGVTAGAARPAGAASAASAEIAAEAQNTSGEAEAADGDDTARLWWRLRPRSRDFRAVAVASFAVIMVAEFGDVTQVIVASLAARYSDPATVIVGAVLALWAAAALAILGGRSLARIVPLSLIARLAAAVMAVLGALSIVGAVTA